MQCPGDWENGFKENRVMRFGDGERWLSHMRTGDVQGSTFSLTISDYDRHLRELFISESGRYWSEPWVIKITNRATRAAKGNPFVVFVGPILDAQPIMVASVQPGQPEGMAWEVTLSDIVSQGLLSDQSQAPWRKIGDGFLSQFQKVSEDLDRDTPEPIIYGIHKRLPEHPPSGEGLVYKPTYLGIMNDEHVWLVAGHACADSPMQYVDYRESLAFTFINAINYASDTFANERTYALVTAPVTDPGFLDPDEDIDQDPDVITDPDACALGIKSLTVWVEGVEPTGFGFGSVIISRILQYEHFAVNYLANQGAACYQSGPYLSNPEWNVFDVDVPIIDTLSFATAEAISLERFAPGYAGAAIIGAKAGDRKTLPDWVAAWNRSCGLRSFITNLGRFKVFMLHPTQAIKDAAPLIEETNDILEGSFRPWIRRREHANRTPFLYDYSHETGKYLGADAYDEGISINGYRKTILGETMEFPFAPGITNAFHLAIIYGRQVRFPPHGITAETALGPLTVMDNGDYVRYRHHGALSASASQIRLGVIERHQVQAGKRRVQADILDVDELIGFDAPGLTAGEEVFNDRCATAREFVYVTPTEGNSWWQRFTQDTTPHTVDATVTGLVAPYSDQKPAWFKFTAPDDGNLSIVTATSAYDTVLYYLTGTCGAEDWTIERSGGGEVGDRAAQTIDLVWGQTVYVLIVGRADPEFGYLLAQAGFSPVVI